MKLENRLAVISDDALLEELRGLVRRQNRLTAVLLAHIAEVDRRRLYLREACSSMHRYCTERLGLSDGAAYKRVHAARAARRFPVLFDMIERGELHLKGVTLLAPHLTENNYGELLARAKGQPVRAIEKLVAELAPRPDVPSRVRALPSHRHLQTESGRAPAPVVRAPEAARVSPPTTAGAPDTPSKPAPSEPQHRPIAPLSPQRYELRVTIDEGARADLEQLQGLLAHQIPGGDPAEIVSRALALLLDRTLARKAAITDRPRSREDNSGGAQRSRYIPAEVRRNVWLRDEGRCAFRDAGGNRCTSTAQLEFHHLDNWARGADHDPHRLELRCRAHNIFQATLDYGAAFMEAAKHGRSSAREPDASYAFPGQSPPAPAGRLPTLSRRRAEMSTPARR